ncbi:Hypothetical predicted protein [Podarcis lilfordi]|uniref:Uncharacterized protein n=1 Tax=Podarcis lilfordi TaxID=74358 RepID=A0AA35PMT1_9SAUR|nr:Hypothetical predicted protein [Podarcis lilfordi]
MCVGGHPLEAAFILSLPSTLLVFLGQPFFVPFCTSLPFFLRVIVDLDCLDNGYKSSDLFSLFIFFLLGKFYALVLTDTLCVLFCFCIGMEWKLIRGNPEPYNLLSSCIPFLLQVGTKL